MLDYCIKDAKEQNKSGVCILSAKVKKPFLSEKKFVQKFGFETVDKIGNEYELMALSFDGSKPKFATSVWLWLRGLGLHQTRPFPRRFSASKRDGQIYKRPQPHGFVNEYWL